MDERVPDHTVTLKCGYGEQKITRNLHVFVAEQFRGRWRVGKRNVFPLPSARDDSWWQNRFRIRLDGCWYGTEAKYRFFTMVELASLIGKLLNGKGE